MGKPKFDPTKSFEVLDGQKPKFDPNASFDVVEEKPKPPGVSTLESALRGAGQGASLGFSDEITGGLEAGLNAIKNTSFDRNQILKDYLMSRDGSRKSNETARADNPSTYMAGDVGASIATAFVPGLNLAKGATLTARAAQAAAMGAASGLGMSNSDSGVELLKDTAIGGALGGAFQGVGEKVIGPLVSKAGSAAKSSINKLSGFVDDQVLPKIGWGGALVPEDATRAYLQSKGTLQAPEKKNILDELTSLFSKSETDLNQAKESVDWRKQLAKTSDDAVKQKRFDVANEIQIKKADLRDLKFQAKSDLDEAFMSKKDGLRDAKFQAKSDLDQAKLDLRDSKFQAKSDLDEAFMSKKDYLKNDSPLKYTKNILDGIDTLKQQVKDESSNAFSILDSNPSKVSVKPIRDLLSKQTKDLTINGTPISDSAADSLRNLEKLDERLGSLGDNVSFSDAKKIMQQLDSDISISQAKGSFAPEADMIKSNVRRQFDEVLKNASPAYKSQMEVVSRKTELLKNLSSQFGTEPKVMDRLNSISTDKGRSLNLDLLNNLSRETTTDIVPGIDKYIKNQDLLSSPLELQNMKRSLPQHDDFLKAESAYAENQAANYTNNQDLLSSPLELQNMKRSLPQHDDFLKADSNYNSFANTDNIQKMKNPFGPSREEIGNLEAYKSFDDAERTLQSAKDSRQFLSPISPQSVESRVNSLGGTRKYSSDEFFTNLDNKYNSNFQEQIKNRGFLDSFKKGDTNGSRKTLLGSTLGAASGFLAAGPAGAAAGASVGALAGQGADRFAGPMFKKLLDGRISSGEFMQNLAPKLGKFAEPLANAAKKGNSSVAATHFILQQTNPEYRKITTEISDE